MSTGTDRSGRRALKIALLYPPPWKIPEKGEPPDPRDGPPDEYRPGDLDADFYQTPYGLFSLAAQAMRAGHRVKVLNLSAFTWEKVEEVVRSLDADIFGMSCWTANRRGVALVAKEIRKTHPRAHIVVGGPHATPLAREMLRHHPAIDTICTGESDVTFLELCDRIARGESTKGLAGTVFRDGNAIVEGPERASIRDLDQLACVHDRFATHILMTSRGCPWACTFCGADTTWGRGFRSHSNEYVLNAIERALAKLPVKMMQIKDDTFTTNKKRVLELCKGMRARKLSFLWSCDTRVDLLNEELLREMRLAGCQRLSLGVESGSQRILDAIDKKITLDEIARSTDLAKSFGIRVRYYMMIGNRGETRATFDETLRFLARTKPHEYVFACLSIYPGTRDFHDAEAAGWLDREAYFKGKFQELKTPFDASEEDLAYFNAWFADNSGLRKMAEETVAEHEAILARLGDHHAAHMDLAAALYRERRFDEAERHVRRAMELGWPLPGLALNHLACIAFAKGDLDGMMDRFSEAAKTDPQHYILIQNVNRARAWFAANGPSRKLPLDLVVSHDFQLLERTTQPTLPGPLPPDFATWEEPSEPQAADAYVKTPDVEGSTKGLDARRRLTILS